MPTKLWDVYDGLVDLWTPAVRPAGAVVLDGPQPRPSTPQKLYVIVGTDGGDSGLGDPNEDASGQAEQSWANLGTRSARDEEGEVPFGVWCLTGSTGAREARVKLRVVADLMESALAANRTLKIGDAAPVLDTPAGWCGLTRLTLRQTQYERKNTSGTVVVGGLAVRLAGAVRWTARLNPPIP